MDSTAQSTPYQEDLSVSTVTILLHAIWMTVIFIIVPLLPFSFIWGRDPLLVAFTNPQIIIPALVVVVVHELLHALAWKIAGGLSFREFKFGIAWKTLSPYCHATRPMPITAYRVGVVVPGIILGIIPVVIATIIGDGVLAVLGALLIAGAVGDVYVLWLLRKVPADARVIDHPTRAGCIVLHDAPINKENR